jgi:hypothetical protein
VKQGISIAAVLIALVVAGAPAMAAPTGFGDAISQQKQSHRTNWVQVVRHKVMGVVAAVEGGIAEAGAQKAKMKAAMAAKTAMAAKAKQEAAMAAKAKQEAASKPQS